MIFEEFEKLVAEAITQLPANIRANMDNVAVVIEDSPSGRQRLKAGLRADDLLFGLYEGIPKTSRGAGYTGVLPDKITIFKDSIEIVAKTPEDIKAQVMETVWHEIAHHFGINEERVRKLSRERKAKGKPE